MRWVLDTNVLVAAARSPKGASAALLAAARQGRFRPCATPALFLEYEAVLKRPEHLRAGNTTLELVDAALPALASLFEPVMPDVKLRPVLQDPDDDMVLEAVINGQAEGLVTFEVTTFRAAGRHFGFAVLTPAQAWAILRA